MKDERIKKIFLEAILHRNNKTVLKDDIIEIAKELEIELPKRISKERLINIVSEKNFTRLYKAFYKHLYIPVWIVAKFYNLDTYKFNKLIELKLVDAPAEKIEGYKLDYEVYNMTILEKYSETELAEMYSKAFDNTKYKVRIETDTEEEVEPLLGILSKVFNVENETTYPRRDGGYNSYFAVTKVKDIDNIEVNKYKMVKDELQQTVKAYGKHIDTVIDIFDLGYFDEIQLRIFKKNYDKFINENEQLKQDIGILNNDKFTLKTLLDATTDESDKLIKENTALQIENKNLKEEVERLTNLNEKYREDNRRLGRQSELNEKFYKDTNTSKQKLEETLILSAKKNIKIMELEKEVEELKARLESNIVQKNNERNAGRKERFTAQDKAMINMHRLQGKSMREIAKEFQCSVGLIHKIINEQ